MSARWVRAGLGGVLQLLLLCAGAQLLRGDVDAGVWAWIGMMTLWAAAEAGAQSPDDRADPADLASAMGAVALVVVVLLGLAEPSALPESLRLAGLGLLAMGLGLRVWAVWTLGAHFRARPQSGAQALVADGPYAHLRHPGELGLVLACGGTAAALGSGPALLACALLVLPLTHWRVSREEAAMRRGTRAGYAGYAARVPRWGLGRLRA